MAEFGNLFLDSLPEASSSRLTPHLHAVKMPLRTSLFKAQELPRYVHFMTSGIASVVTMMESGEAVEMGLTGTEGFPEKMHLLGTHVGMTECFIQVEAAALRMDFERFRGDFLQDPILLRAVLQYAQYEALVLAQLGACNRLHEVEERLARWLLMVQDRLHSAEIVLTQEFLGEMLGTRRSSVNLAVGSLQRSGIVENSRGKIKILSRPRLEAAACECYSIIARLHTHLY